MAQRVSIVKAVSINAVGKYSKIALVLIVNGILSRLLSPEDFGIIAVVMVFSTFFSTLSDVGFGTAIIQRKDLSNYDINNIFSFTVMLSFIFGIIFACLAYPISFFYNENKYFSVIILLSFALFFNASNMVPNGILTKNKKFAIIAFRNIIIYISTSIIAIALAFYGLRYYAVVFQNIISAICIFFWNYLTLDIKFFFNIDFSSISKVISYSGFQFGFNFINYFSRNLDSLLIGKFLGNVQLGYYNRAYSLMLCSINNLAGVITPVLHPVLSDYQNQKDLLFYKYMKIVKILFFIGIYVESICFLSSKEIILLIFGSQWTPSIECFKYLSLAIVTQMVNSSTGAIFQSAGTTKCLFIVGFINTCITVSAIILGLINSMDIYSLSLFIAVGYLLHFITSFYTIVKVVFKKSLLWFIKELKLCFVTSLIMMTLVCIWPIYIENLFMSIAFKFIYVSIPFGLILYCSGYIRSLKSLLTK